MELGWKNVGASVLERLWKSYGIIHAILIAPCSQTGESVKYQYNILMISAIRTQNYVKGRKWLCDFFTILRLMALCE